MKLSLGTAQFGLDYGINNVLKKLSYTQVEEILNLAFENNIRFLDTSPAYGDAELKIGALVNDNFNIISKFPFVSNAAALKSALFSSHEKLRTKKLYGYIAHNANNLIEIPQLWSTLSQLKEENRIQKIGYSVYTTDQLEKLLNIDLIPDLIQLPYSLLDRQFEKYFIKLKKLGVEIHVRSIFLQGLYFMNPDSLPAKLKSFHESLVELNKICNDLQTNLGMLALNFVTNNQLVDRVLIGIDSKWQLIDNIELYKNCNLNSKQIEKIRLIEVKDKELLNPVNW